ncbi:MAG: DnaT-like ssDNA-binding domain-containing protein [Candidatus Hodarchaeales archaeon]
MQEKNTFIKPIKWFTQVHNAIINDANVSLKAKGLYLYLESKPDGWDFYIKEIALNNKDGLESVRGSLNELQSNGYIEKVQTKNEMGQFSSYDIKLIYKPCAGNPVSGQSNASNTNILNNTNLNNKKETKVSTKKPAIEHKGTKLPTDWQPSTSSAEHLENELGYPADQIKREYLSFIDYWTEGDGMGKKKINWDSAFKNWVRKRPPFKNNRDTSNGIF